MSSCVYIYNNCYRWMVDLSFQAMCLKNTLKSQAMCILPEWIRHCTHFLKFSGIIHIAWFYTLTVTYISFSYIPHENNVYYNVYDTDIFECISNDIGYFSEKCTVIIAGDLNSRVGNLLDYIEHDSIAEPLLDVLSYVLTYIPKTCYRRHNC